MTELHYPNLGETLYRDVLPNGLTLCVVPRPGFSRKIHMKKMRQQQGLPDS